MLATDIFYGRHPPLHRGYAHPISNQMWTSTTAKSWDWTAANKGIGNSKYLDSQRWYAQLVKQQTICRFLLMATVRQRLIVTTQLVQLLVVCQHVLLCRLHLKFGILHVEGLYLSDYL